MENLFVTERWALITSCLERTGRATVGELAERLGVSSATIRRDLRQMEAREMITRAHGGAVRGTKVGLDRSSQERQALFTAEKQTIGQRAAELIENGDTVMIDGGSTACQVVRHLGATGVTFITNDLEVAAELMKRPEVDVIVIGGMLRKGFGSLIGPIAVQELASLVADKAVIGIDGISAGHGISTPNPLVAEVKQLMLARAKESIILADHSKLGVETLCRVAALEDVDKIVTDAGATEEQVKTLVEAGVEVIVAG